MAAQMHLGDGQEQTWNGSITYCSQLDKLYYAEYNETEIHKEKEETSKE